MPVLYDLVTGLYFIGIRCASPFNKKAKQWVAGRKQVFLRLEANAEALCGCLWMHCASAGEFEQGRPVLEGLLRDRPDMPVVLTFFSPSGFEAFKDLHIPGHRGRFHVDHLPSDSATNAKRFLRTLEPSMAVFVRYEFWYHYLNVLRKKRIPTFLVSATFRPTQPFFRWYGGVWRSMLQCFTRVLVQDQTSEGLLKGIGVRDVRVCGDSRHDRVTAIAAENAVLSEAEVFVNAGKGAVLVCGSTWPADDDLLVDAMGRMEHPPRVLIAPHEPSENGEREILERFPAPVARWSGMQGEMASEVIPHTCLVDRVGVLARLYKYADVAYVGGGFTSGIHSVLEAAAWGRPVVFGPDHHKFPEAQALIDAGGGFAVRDAEELHSVLRTLVNDEAARVKASQAALGVVRAGLGATARMIQVIEEVI